MQELTGTTLQEALQLCDTFGDVNVGIILTSRKAIDDFISTFLDQVNMGYMNGWKVCSSFDGGIIKSPTGSTIRLFSEDRSTTVYGARFNKVLYEPGVDYAVLSWLFSIEAPLPLPSRGVELANRFRTLYMNRLYEPQETVSEELNDFLNSFKII